MPRTGKVPKRQIVPDLLHQSPLVAKLINKVMKDGKKALAQKIVYGALDAVRQENQDPIKILEKALENTTPRMEVRPRRVGGASYMVPLEVRGPRRQSLALSWLVGAARSRLPKEVKSLKKLPLAAAKLAAEIQEAANGTGRAVTKRAEMHRMAEANKAFAHFRW